MRLEARSFTSSLSNGGILPTEEKWRDYSGAQSLEPITWDEWFESFDDNDLALACQDKTATGKRSSFNKLVRPETAEKRAHGDNKPSRHRTPSMRKTTRRRSRTSRAKR